MNPTIEDHTFAERLLGWFDQHGRHDLPWQHPRSAYRVWISESMLQQTQVATVVPYFQRFMCALPDIAALAQANADHVLALWSGLGYYSRARRLHEAARICMREHGGALPSDPASLLALPGIGRSTAGAILALAHGLACPILDGNVRRVFCRHLGVRGWPGRTSVQKGLWRIAEEALPSQRLADYTQALMDLGATVCTPSTPRCERCPVRSDCVALRDGLVTLLPERAPTRPRPERSVHVLVVCDREGRMLLQKRPAVGVWASLWSLPEAASFDEARSWLVRHVEAESPQMLPPIRHAFTHFKLQMHPLIARDARPRAAVADRDDMRWHRRDEFHEIALPAPVRKLLEELSQ